MPAHCATTTLRAWEGIDLSLILQIQKKNAPAPAESKTQPTQTEKPKPCCVCKEEKAARDDCMLFSKSDDPQKECQSMVEKYKTCMAGFGFKV